MKKILLTIDTEFIVSKKEILGINGSNGLNDILSILSEYDIKATFFIDYYEQRKWGDEIFSNITDSIISYGHQVELHLHPDIVSDNPYLWQYNYSEQNNMLEESILLFRKFNGRNPQFFRAGSYSADNNTLAILKEKEFLADLSFQYKQTRCKITKSKFPYKNKLSNIDGLMEFPTTVYQYSLFKEKFNSINMEWCSLSELKEISRQIKKSDLDYFVIMMHSFSFLKRWDRKRFSKNNSQKNKLRKYLQFAKDSNFEFVTVKDFFNDVKNDKLNINSDFVPQIKNIFAKLSGIKEKIKNKFILNSKFRYQLVGFFSLSTILSLLTIYLFFFNYFSPGYKEVENVKVDINSWNNDNDISTIENYFIELENYKSKIVVQKDKNGIIFRAPYSDKKKYIMKTSSDSLYIATDMSGAIIREFNKFNLSQDSTHYNNIILYSDWLKTIAVIKNDFAMWPYHFKFTKYNLDFDWCGSWALGNILSAISRRIQLQPDSNFITLADQIVNSFEIHIEDGGILFIDDNKDFWFEEYPTTPPNHVLNGHINGLMGLYDYWRISGNRKAKYLFDKGCKTTANNLEKFDSGYWSYYDDQYPYIADYYYHKTVHIPQLKVLYQLTKNEIFRNYAQKWESYLDEPYYTLYKLKMIYDGFHRRFTYKSFFTLGK